MARIGGELEQLVSLKAVFDREAGTVDELTRTIRGQLASTAWEGPAADRFRQMWDAEFVPNLSKLRTALQDAALEVSRRREALMQAGG
jgi:WXG100 family type VII secretion target